MAPDADRARSKGIAAILGPTLAIVAVSETINLHIWASMSPPITYLNGMILFVAGLAIVRFHHRWRADWTIIVTLVGWLIMIAGAARLFFPEAARTMDTSIVYPMTAFLCVVGLFLTYKSLG
ncbi:MAG: hypothetical protein AAFX08_01215 [Pseudomonadota bacterium]